MVKRGKRIRMKTVNSVDEVIDILGGPTWAAKKLKVDPTSVSMWKIRGHVARGFHLHVFLTLRKRGYAAAPAVFGLDSWDQVIIPRAVRRPPPTKRVKRAA